MTHQYTSISTYEEVIKVYSIRLSEIRRKESSLTEQSTRSRQSYDSHHHQRDSAEAYRERVRSQIRDDKTSEEALLVLD